MVKELRRIDGSKQRKINIDRLGMQGKRLATDILIPAKHVLKDS